VAKLVRDGIPGICRANGQEPIITVASPDEHLGLLLDKLTEEAAEARDADAAERAGELADVLEVVFSIAYRDGISREHLEEVRAAKAAARGGFSQGLVWHGNQVQRQP
jgi:predicted house-cleaning noncanonical NTP pyrophosphatase (MazG superfamily)